MEARLVSRARKINLKQQIVLYRLLSQHKEIVDAQLKYALITKVEEKNSYFGLTRTEFDDLLGVFRDPVERMLERELYKDLRG